MTKIDGDKEFFHLYLNFFKFAAKVQHCFRMRVRKVHFFVQKRKNICIYGKKAVLLHAIMAKIGVFDSGYGGLTILDAIRRNSQRVTSVRLFVLGR